jgi:hypothetical protein
MGTGAAGRLGRLAPPGEYGLATLRAVVVAAARLLV